MEKKCPICNRPYTEKDPEIIYHVTYKPENIITDTCNNCNYAEYLIRHPEIPTKYNMIKRMHKVQKWTVKNRPLIL